MNKRTDLRYWGSVTSQMWSNTKIYGRWTGTLLQRDKRELLNIAWHIIKERFGIDAVFDNSVGFLLDHRRSRIRHKQTKKPMLAVTVAENAGDPGAKIFLTPVNPFSFAQMEDMIEDRMKKEYEDRMKTIADSRAARATNNFEFVPKFHSSVKRSALKYVLETNVQEHQRPPDPRRIQRHLGRDSRTRSKDHLEREMHGSKDRARDRAEPEDEAEAEAETTTERDSHPDDKKEEVQDQEQEEDGTGNGKELATQAGTTSNG